MPDLTLNPETVKQLAADIHTAYADVEARAALCDEAVNVLDELLFCIQHYRTGGVHPDRCHRAEESARAVLAKARLPGEGA